MRFVRLWAPKSKGLEAVLHTFVGVLVAGLRRPDILHIQAIGPGLMTPLASLDSRFGAFVLELLES